MARVAGHVGSKGGRKAPRREKAARPVKNVKKFAKVPPPVAVAPAKKRETGPKT